MIGRAYRLYMVSSAIYDFHLVSTKTGQVIGKMKGTVQCAAEFCRKVNRLCQEYGVTP